MGTVIGFVGGAAVGGAVGAGTGAGLGTALSESVSDIAITENGLFASIPPTAESLKDLAKKGATVVGGVSGAAGGATVGACCDIL